MLPCKPLANPCINPNRRQYLCYIGMPTGVLMSKSKSAFFIFLADKQYGSSKTFRQVLTLNSKTPVILQQDFFYIFPKIFLLVLIT